MIYNAPHKRGFFHRFSCLWSESNPIFSPYSADLRVYIAQLIFGILFPRKSKKLGATDVAPGYLLRYNG